MARIALIVLLGLVAVASGQRQGQQSLQREPEADSEWTEGPGGERNSHDAPSRDVPAHNEPSHDEHVEHEDEDVDEAGDKDEEHVTAAGSVDVGPPTTTMRGSTMKTRNGKEGLLSLCSLVFPVVAARIFRA